MVQGAALAAYGSNWACQEADKVAVVSRATGSDHLSASGGRRGRKGRRGEGHFLAGAAPSRLSHRGWIKQCQLLAGTRLAGASPPCRRKLLRPIPSQTGLNRTASHRFRT